MRQARPIARSILSTFQGSLIVAIISAGKSLTGLAPWEFESPLPGSLKSTFLQAKLKEDAKWLARMRKTEMEDEDERVPPLLSLS